MTTRRHAHNTYPITETLASATIGAGFLTHQFLDRKQLFIFGLLITSGLTTAKKLLEPEDLRRVFCMRAQHIQLKIMQLICLPARYHNSRANAKEGICPILVSRKALRNWNIVVKWSFITAEF